MNGDGEAVIKAKRFYYSKQYFLENNILIILNIVLVQLLIHL